MFAIRAVNLTRGPLNVLPKPSAGGPKLKKAAAALGGMLRGGPKKKKDEKEGRGEQMLLEDVSFEIEQGTITAIPGADQRATEALGRMLVGSLQPTAGRLEVRGSIAGLLKVGENLDADSTAYELIGKESRYLNVAEESKDAFRDEVLEFSGLREFEDVQIRRFSTGMGLRLGLSMILVAKPSIVVMGDILGVGDLDFRQRTWDRVKEMSRDGTTFLLIGPGYGSEGTDRRFLIERGRVTGDTLTRTDDTDYLPEGPAAHTWHRGEDSADNVVLAVQGVTALPPKENRRRTEIRIRMMAKVEAVNLRVVLDLVHNQTIVLRSVTPNVITLEEPCSFGVSVSLPPILAALPYRVRITCHAEHEGRTRTIQLANALNAIPTVPAQAADMDAVPVFQPDWDWTINAIETEKPALPEETTENNRAGRNRRAGGARRRGAATKADAISNIEEAAS